MKTQTIALAIALTSILFAFKLKAQDQPLKVKEFGIGFSSFNSFSLQYRWGNEHRLFRISGNIGGTTSNGNSSDNATTVKDTTSSNSSGTAKSTSPINLNCGLSFSILKIKSVSEKFGIVYGGISAFTYSVNQTNTDGTSNINSSTFPNNNRITTSTTKKNSQTFQPSLGIAFGAVYKFNSSFSLYAEIDPNIYYAYTKSTTHSTTATNYTNYSYNNYTKTDNNYGSTNTFGLANFANSGASLTIVYRITK